MELFRLLGKILVNNGEANENIDETTKKANEMAKNLGNKFTSAGKTITKVGKVLMPFSVAIGGIGIASAKMSSDFSNALAKVSTIADTSQVPMDDMRKAIMDLSNQTGISSAEIADNVYNAISAGQQTGDAVNFVSNATKLAKAGFTDSASALDILTTAMNAYGLEASEVNNVSDLLITTQNLGKTTVGELAGQMGRVIPTANAYGVQLDQLCTGYALLTANGINTAESTTYINAMLNELGKSGTQVSDVIQNKTGQSFQELMNSGKSLGDVLQIVEDGAEESGLSLGDLFGSSEAAKAALVMLGDGAEEFNGTLDKMNGSTGATNQAFDKMQTKSEQFHIAINKLKNTMVLLGDAIMVALVPVLNVLSAGAENVYNWFSNLSPGMQQVIVTLGMLLTAIGPVLIVIGKMATGWGAIVTVLPKVMTNVSKVMGKLKMLWGVLMANPIMLVVGIIGALVAAFIYLWNTSEGFRNFWINLWNSIKEKVSTAVNAIKDGISSGFNAAKNTVTTIFNNIKNTITDKINTAKDIVKTAIDKIKGFFNFSWSLPKLKLPHFSIKGKFSLKPPQVPKFGIEWYKNGAIMNKPTMFDYDTVTNTARVGGEAGPEAIAPLSRLEEYYKKWSSQGNVELINLMKTLIDKLPSKDELKDIMVAALSDGSFSVMLDGREVGRIVKQYA